MAFQLKLPDLSKLGAALSPAYVKTRDFFVTNRVPVLAASVALMVGLWSGVVLGRVSAGVPPTMASIAAVEGVLGGENARSADAPRAHPEIPGMAFVRLRAETNTPEPRACLEFSRNLSTDANIHYQDYLEIEPAAPIQTDISGSLLCISGLPLEPDRRVTIKAGLPADTGERTEAAETFTLTFGDRPSYVGFVGNGVILPRAEADGLAIETVNVSKIEVEVLRVPDRILSQRQINPGEVFEEGGWGWTDGEDVGVSVYQGEIDVASAGQRNNPVTTVFAMGAALREMRPGAYIVKIRDDSPGAGSRGEYNENPAQAYRWIIYTDLALQTFSGQTGIDVVVRSLRTARPVANATVTLIAQNNEELARTRTDGEGHVRFSEALTSGTGPAQARYIMAYGAEGDFAALDLYRSSLDLSDRGVDGRRAPGDVDAYLWTERGIYRPGERVRLMGMIRDNVGRVIGDRQSTLVVYRPNGTEARRFRLTEAGESIGGIAKNIDLDRSSPRGQWHAELTVDGQEEIAGAVAWSVEDFVPQRLRVRIDAQETVLLAGQSRPLSVQADFLYGAPGAGLPVEGEGRLTVDGNPFPDHAGFMFGKDDESFDERMFQLPSTTTDGTGHADLLFQLDSVPETTLPLRASIITSVADPGGRMVRERFSVPVRTRDLYFGLKPRFENSRAGAGERVSYELIAVNAQGQRAAARGVQWQIIREDWSYDWYLDNGRWRWRRTGRDIPVDGATIDVGAGNPTVISKDGLREGSYRLLIRGAGTEASQRFGVGWGGPADDDATPDMVTVVAPDDPVRAGGRARVQIRPPYAGEAQIVVATDRVIETRTVRVGPNGTSVDLSVTDEWGSGAYVLVTVMTPRDPVNLPVPRRAIGVSYVPVDMARRTLQVAVGEGLQNVRPRQRLEVPIQVRGANNERVRVVIAAVDEGILNLTKYESPNPVDYFFGRRALGVDVRDDYGRLLNPNLGAPATARQGGDSLGGEGLTVVPTKTVSLYSDFVELRGGRATIPLDIPDFNGTLRLMAVAWSDTAVGQDSEELIVRDQVVAELILPRFLAPGDAVDATLNIDNVEGPNGAYTVTVSGTGAAQAAASTRRFSLTRGNRQTALIPISGGAPGIGRINLRLEGPNGFTPIERSYDIQSRPPFMPITLVDTAPLPAGAQWRAASDALARFQPQGATAQISFSNLAGLDPAPLIDALYRYPYGCSEQLTSVAMPLLYYNTLGAEAGRARDPRIVRRVQEAATQLLDRQGPDGAFGLWSAGDRNASPWLGAYVTDFLQRAKAEGYAVPQAPLDSAYNALRQVARLNDGAVGYQFEIYRWPGSNDSDQLMRSRAAAYALYVLAKAGRVDIGQVRYFFDARLRDDPSPLARAQIGAALAHLGDRARSRDAFRMAESAIGYRNTGDYYQSPVRDLAGVLALAAEAGETELVDRLRRRLEREANDPNMLMTQEQVQLLLAANALLQRAGPITVSMNGERMQSRRHIADAQQLVRGLVFRNDGRGVIWRSLTTNGSPREAPPPMANGFSIDKRVFTMTGEIANLDTIRQGDRVVVVLSGRPDGARMYPTVLVDLLPAGLEIESVLRPEDGLGSVQWDGTRRSGPFVWVGGITYADIAEARDDRFVASRNLRAEEYRFAYVARAVTPGRYTLPAAQVEDMYRPGVMARTSTGTIRISPRGG